MPIYEYFCPDCESKFELLRPLSKSNEGAECPRCHKKAERALSTFACFSKDKSGLSSSIGPGSACSSCHTGTCSTCGP